MGNAFGNYASAEAAEAAIMGMGFAPSAQSAGIYCKRDMTGGNMFEAPRMVTALTRVIECKVAPQYGGKSYYQIEYI